MANPETTTNPETTSPNLLKMSEELITLANPQADLRGRKVVDRHDEEIGKVDDLLVDDREREVRFLSVKSGGFLGLGGKNFLVPVDALQSIHEDHVSIDQSREHVGEGPSYDPKVVIEGQAEYERVYQHYGYTPFWAPGYAYPALPFYRP